MSATDWQLCPRCYAMAEKNHAQRIKDATASYGKIEIKEWMKENSEAQKPIEHKETLREDYEMFIGEDGLFYVSYSAGCDICGFEHRFKHEEQLPVEVRS